MDKFNDAIRAICAKTGATPNKPHNKLKEPVGVITCPICKKELHYAVSDSNHHIWGQCSTKNCLSWMM